MSSKSIKCLGFTLVELLTTIAIVAILLGIAIPSFTTMMQSNRITSITNSLVTSISYARNEAIKRGTQVTMERTGATAGDWSSGWIICQDDNTDNNCASGTDTILRTVEAVPDGYSITTGNSHYDTYAAFLANGLPRNPAGETFTICEGTHSSTSRRVIINFTGRANVEGAGTC